MKPTEADINAAKAAHAGIDLHLLPYDNGEGAVIARSPSAEAWRKFVTQVSADPKKAPFALESLSRNCIVWPAADPLDALLTARPGLPASFGDALSKLAGASQEIEAKKL